MRLSNFHEDNILFESRLTRYLLVLGLGFERSTSGITATRKWKIGGESDPG